MKKLKMLLLHAQTRNSNIFSHDAKQHKFLYNQPLATVVSMSHTIYHATCKSFVQREGLSMINTSNGIREMHITAVVTLHDSEERKIR